MLTNITNIILLRISIEVHNYRQPKTIMQKLREIHDLRSRGEVKGPVGLGGRVPLACMVGLSGYLPTRENSVCGWQSFSAIS